MGAAPLSSVLCFCLCNLYRQVLARLPFFAYCKDSLDKVVSGRDAMKMRLSISQRVSANELDLARHDEWSKHCYLLEAEDQKKWATMGNEAFKAQKKGDKSEQIGKPEKAREIQ